MTNYNWRVNDAWLWVAEGWSLFWKKPLAWLLITVLGIIIEFAVNLFPRVGAIAAIALCPLLAAGMLYAARELDAGRDLRPVFVFQALKEPGRTVPLLLLGLVPLMTSLLALLLGRVLTGHIYYAVSSALFLLTIFALFYAVPIVMFDGKGAFAALLSSLRISMANLVPIAVFLSFWLIFAFGLVLAVGFIFGPLAMIPSVTFGLLLFIPLTICVVYQSYRHAAAPLADSVDAEPAA
jgi:hypothetical protein